MRESCLVYCYSGIQSLFEVVLLYTFYTLGKEFRIPNSSLQSNKKRHFEFALLDFAHRTFKKLQQELG